MARSAQFRVHRALPVISERSVLLGSSTTHVPLVCEASRATRAPFAVHTASSCGGRRHKDGNSGLQMIKYSVHTKFF